MTALTFFFPALSSHSPLPHFRPPSSQSYHHPSCRIPHNPWPSSQALGRRRSPPVCRMAEYKFPDPIPEFALAEIEKFEEHMFTKLSKKETLFGDSIPQVVGICTQILNNFLHSEYQGPGTLLVDPFIDMADAIQEHGLPGSPQAARIAVKWAQKHVDKDWKDWTGFDL